MAYLLLVLLVSSVVHAATTGVDLRYRHTRHAFGKITDDVVVYIAASDYTGGSGEFTVDADTGRGRKCSKDGAFCVSMFYYSTHFIFEWSGNKYEIKKEARTRDQGTCGFGCSYDETTYSFSVQY